MIRTENWEHKTYELECISPIHIGNGQLLKQYEYILLKDRNQQRVCFLDKMKWMRFLMDHDLVDDYAGYVFSNRRSALYPWLRQHNLDVKNVVRKVCHSSADVYFVRQGQENTNDIFRQVKLPTGDPYIPGSSLKGAIHSAILFHAIQKEPEKYLNVWSKIKNVMCSGRGRNQCGKELEIIKQELEKDILCRLPQRTKNFDAALQSAMKGISVSDAMLVGEEKDTLILQKYDVSAARNEALDDHGISVFRECIPAGRKLTFSMTLDKNIAKYIELSSLAELWKWTREFVDFGLEKEEKVFGHAYEGEFQEAILADLILGGGTGFLSKTIYYALAPSEEEGQEVLAKFFDEVLFTGKGCHHHEAKDGDLTPRTLKLATTGSDRWILGLASIKEVSSC